MIYPPTQLHGQRLRLDIQQDLEHHSSHLRSSIGTLITAECSRMIETEMWVGCLAHRGHVSQAAQPSRTG